jgi:glycosyltransferase involved in cell wall biosynthesis
MTSNHPEHTFVILAYKESKYLEGCIESVLGQSLPCRVLIATSTPNQHISDLASKYALEVRVNANTGSIGKDWNFGYQCADTKYVTIAHQDDIYLRQFAEECVNAARKDDHAKPLMVFNRSLTYKGDREVSIHFKNILRWIFILPFHFKNCIQSKSIKKSILLFSNSISCPGVFYVKENLGAFHFHEEEKYILDWRAWFDMSQMDGSFIYVPEILHIHREHEESATSTTQLETLQLEEFKLLRDIWGSSFMPRIITWILRFAKL